MHQRKKAARVCASHSVISIVFSPRVRRPACSCACMSTADGKVAAGVRVLRRYPEWGTLDTREDYCTLCEVAAGYRGSAAVRLVAGSILHSFYHPRAVRSMAAALRLPSDTGRSSMQWATAAERSLAVMLRRADKYDGPQGFPYQWIPAGKVIARSLRSHLKALYEACVVILSSPRRSMSGIDRFSVSMYMLSAFPLLCFHRMTQISSVSFSEQVTTCRSG